MLETLGNYGFRFLEDVENPPIELLSIGIEKRDSDDYYFDNQARTDSYLFQYTLSGSGTVVLDGKPREIFAGEAFFLKLPGKEKYYFNRAENHSPWHFIYIMFRGNGAKGYFEKIIIKKGNIISLSQDSPCIQYLTQMYYYAASGHIPDPYSASAMTFSFLCSLCSVTLKSKENASKMVESALQIMDQEFSSLNGISEVAERLNISQQHLSREFAKTVGITPVNYLTKTRLQCAVELLHNTNMHIDEIAVKSGFSCGNYFCKVFQKHLKLSPSAFRNNDDNILYTKVRL